MSRVLAALEGDFDAPENEDGAQDDPLSRGVGGKRKWEQEMGTPGPSNKRPTTPLPRGELNRLPPGLLAATQSLNANIEESPSTQQDIRRLFGGTVTGPGIPFNLNYGPEAPISRLDIGGHDQNERLAEFVSKSIDNLSHGLLVKDGMKYLGLRDAKDLLPGLEVRLIPHQIIGVTWMLMQEKETQYKGGIMADEMGLGKTVQMIATMAMNMPEMNEKYRTTLIVVPAALMHQWKEELESKTNGIFSVHIHHGKDKLKSLSAMQSKDVIITTYQTLNLDLSIRDDIEDGGEMEYLLNHGGLLAQMRWYRIVLDEAQFVRNRSTRSSKSVAMLRAKYRWMLTGTPVTNSLADLYGLIRFGHFRPWNDWNDFNDHIAKVQLTDPPLAGLRAQGILKPILLRRTKNAQLEGKPLLSLPPKNIDIVTLEFSADERDIYDTFEKRAKIRVNKFIREQTIVKNHAAVLVMILRLRQLCCHPNLILSQAEGFEDPSVLVGSDSDKELARAKRLMGDKWVNQVKKSFLARARALELDFTEGGDEDDSTCPVCHDLYTSESGRVLNCGHEMCYDCMLDLSHSAMAHDGEFGHGNEQQNLKVEKLYETAEAQGLRPCPKCKKMTDLRPAAVFRSSAFEPSEEELREYVRAQRQRGKAPVKTEQTTLKFSSIESKPKKDLLEMLEMSSDEDEDMPDISEILAGSSKVKDEKKGPRKMVIDSDDEDIVMAKKPRPTVNSDDETPNMNSASRQPNAATFAAWRRGDDDLEPSTKMLALIKALKEADTYGDKTIVYSQWTSMLDQIEILFARYGIQNLRYDGKMTREARDATLLTFRKHGGPKVILISTKCGSVGLNLVSANRVVNLDLSWNFAAESQAYDRVHRLGQEKDVFIKRLVVRDTIEERMLKLQELKVGLADAALGEGSGVKLHKMSVKEIKQLFGMTPVQQDPPGVRVDMQPH
ncbi:hypothetical protein DENSPDRAFT_831976 [Dentipellis sp. KUC8613]|nr:hypothetical protein DENSPDRAFT_831976 [Dentipellis sp. KUC8613]